MRPPNGAVGFALTAVIIAILLMVTLAAAALRLASNIRQVQDHFFVGRTRAYYYAQAGTVDAQWRIRNNLFGEYGPNDDPPPYSLDVNGDGLMDVTVDISAEDPTTHLRQISATGRE